MAFVTRWVGACSMLSAVLVAACDGGSSGVNNAAAAGDGSAGTSNTAAGASNAGASSAGASNAGTSNANAGTASLDGVGGTGSGGTLSDAGAAGKTSGGAGTAHAGAAGAQGGGSCGGAQVLFLIQRSGALFEQPGLVNFGEVLPLEESYFGFLQAALAGDGSAAKPYSGKFPIGVSFLFATRDLMTPLPAMCPQLAGVAPSLDSDSKLASAFTQSVSDHAALMTAKQKEEAPVPESIANAVSTWSASGPRHLVLITLGMPDTCTQLDGPCGIDSTVNAVQVARAAGVTTHVIGLGDHVQFNYPDAEGVTVQTGYVEYLQQLANAGSGKPLGPANVEKLQDFACGNTGPALLTATYSATPGDAKYYQVKTATDAKTAVAEVLGSVCP